MALPTRIFVTGTSTDIGKTVVSGVLVAGLRAHYWKPVQTGLNEGTDTDWIRRHTAIPESRIHRETYSLQQPLSPHAAAVLEDVEIKLDAFAIPDVPVDDFLVVEGAGGIMVPLNRQHYMLDLIKSLDIPVLLVADSQLGTINHTLLSLLQLRRCGIAIIGVVMNGPKNQGNREALEFYGEAPILAEIEQLADLNPASLEICFQQCFKSQEV
ncbi:MAG: dethiobiotin synthase [Gammaproteobacteria bacterium]|nr:dethiobiotin synthase [Gammaproteobacteria bacterium]